MPNSYTSLLKTAWRYARQERRKYVLVYAMLLTANIIYAVYPVLLGWFVGHVEKSPKQILFYASLYVGSYIGLKLLEGCIHGPARAMERTLAFNISRNFLQERYHQALHLPVKWHHDHHSGATINRIRKSYEALRHFYENGFMYLHAISKLVFSLAAMLYFSLLFGSISILLGIITIAVIFKFDKPSIKTLEEVNEKEHIVSSTLFDSLSNIMTVLTLRFEKSMETGLLNKVQQVLFPYKKNTIINEWKWFIANMLIALIYGITVIGYVIQQKDTFNIAGLVILLGYVNQFTSVFNDVAWQYSDIVQTNTFVQTAKVIDDAYNNQHRTDSPSALPHKWESIQITDLNFSHCETYDESHVSQCLHHLHLTIPRGKKIALIGESGSGKSTLLALLRGLYAPESGINLTVDGIKYDIASLNNAATLFPQEPEIFENTIIYNISMGLPFSKDDIDEAIENAHLVEVIQQLPAGLESDIREKGVNISGGQKQRLALARGMLAAKESQLVLLDEPTSSVDAKTETLIYQNIFDAFQDKAVISSVHRLHLLSAFDYVYILQQGRIADEGTFEHLYHNSELFQELWRHQKKYTEKNTMS